jgi:hypothetical protein
MFLFNKSEYLSRIEIQKSVLCFVYLPLSN